MHHSLCDTYRFRSKFSEITLLSASVIFLSTTFADSHLYTTLGFQPDISKTVLGITSVFAFICSLTLIILNWPEKAALHKKSAEKWGQALNKFRKLRQEDDTWPTSMLPELNEAYVDASINSIDIPDKQFNKLKAQYLTKVEISKSISKHPGTPHLIIWSIIKVTSIYKALLKK